MNENSALITALPVSVEDEMNKIEQQAMDNNPYPTQAIMVYHNKTGQVFLTLHEVSMTKTGPEIGAGSVMTRNSAHDFANFIINKEDKHSELLPPTVLAATHSLMVWYRETEVRRMWFKVGRKKVSYRVPWPRMIFIATSNGLSVYAIKGRGRPHEDTLLYHAPLMNIYDNGSVCLGNASMPTDFSITSISDMESIIYDTLFSHTNHDFTLKLNGSEEIGNTEHIRFWRELHKHKSDRFPNKVLRRTGYTLGEMIESID